MGINFPVHLIKVWNIEQRDCLYLSKSSWLTFLHFNNFLYFLCKSFTLINISIKSKIGILLIKKLSQNFLKPIIKRMLCGRYNSTNLNKDKEKIRKANMPKISFLKF